MRSDVLNVNESCRTCARSQLSSDMSSVHLASLLLSATHCRTVTLSHFRTVRVSITNSWISTRGLSFPLCQRSSKEGDCPFKICQEQVDSSNVRSVSPRVPLAQGIELITKSLSFRASA